MEEGFEKSKLEKEKEALRQLVKPEDEDWDMRFTEMSDYDRVFRRIMSIANWEEDRQLVQLFVTMRNRKRRYSIKRHSYFCQQMIEEDLEIVPNSLSADYPQPNTEGMPEKQRKLTILAHNFVNSNGFHLQSRVAYDRVYKQFEATEDWGKNPVLVELYEEIQMCEEENEIDIEFGDEPENEYLAQIDEKYINKFHKQMEEVHGKGLVDDEEEIKDYLRFAHHYNNWWKNEKLMYWHHVLLSKLRVMRLKKQGKWDSRIVGLSKNSRETNQQSMQKKGILKSVWDRLWPSKDP